jgi:hypothetical protein
LATETCHGTVEYLTNIDYEWDTTAYDKENNWERTVSAIAGRDVRGAFYDEFGADMGHETHNYRVDARIGHYQVGSLLVRSVDTPVATVSSPAALSLFALGLCGLLLRRRKIAA